MQIRALLLEDKIRDQTLAEQQQKQLEQQAKTMGSRAGGVGSTSGKVNFHSNNLRYSLHQGVTIVRPKIIKYSHRKHRIHLVGVILGGVKPPLVR